ncbi:Gfo/Idh/MocA family protein [Occultella gossypii]|uniref:Gfo/Idh/MocA family oxidoreductase n=1 Tax=Occultella gossypii TaxID=2800820 RepID=A0ABS7SD47_9MICO|nr:Gfo/Idh/MocA family oxidoreductase [Occultella gossypii]MBZ2197171.1 Gfo/Idh/MocA family oxidoreductase [Occultella gossypii]
MTAAGATPVRFALVGAGWWATNHHVPALLAHPDAELVAVCDPHAARAHTLAARTGARAHPDLATALADPACAVDVVLVATPNAHHREPVLTALAAGRHVLVEKPLAVTSADAFAMTTAAERAGLHLAVGLTHQYGAAATFSRRAVREGIGELRQVTAEFSSSAIALFAAAGSDPGDDAPERRHPGAYSAANGGGHATTQLAHVLGLLCWCTGQQMRRVAAFTDSQHPGTDVDVQDAMTFTLERGALGVAIGTAATPDGVPHRQHIRYLGSTGEVSHDLLRARVRWQRGDGSVLEYEPDQHLSAYRPGRPVEAFIDLVLGRGENLGPSRPAAAAVAAVEALLDSARSGSVVDVPALPEPGHPTRGESQ